MAPPIGLTAAALRGDVRTEFLGMLQQQTGKDRLTSLMMNMGVPSTRRTERYVYWESQPIPRLWRRGDTRSRQAHQMKEFEVENFRWGITIPWHEDDAADEQTNSLLEQARAAARGFVGLDPRILFQILLASTDPDLLETIPNAPDGAAIFNATDGSGADRFGVSGGNIISSAGTTAANRRDDFYQAVERILAFQDTQGQPFHAEDLINRGWLLIYGSQHHQQFAEAFLQERIQGTQAAPSNVTLDEGLNITLWPTTRMSGTNNFIVQSLGYARDFAPVFRQVRLAIETFEDNRSNSDVARDRLENAFTATARFGYGVTLPLGTCRVGS